jgi:hypothetical protein
MVTPRRPHRGRKLGLPFSARRWLLGARPRLTGDGGVANGGIVRLRHLIVHASTDAAWAAYLDDLQRQWGPTVRSKQKIWRQRRAEARKRASGRRIGSAKAKVTALTS